MEDVADVEEIDGGQGRDDEEDEGAEEVEGEVVEAGDHVQSTCSGY